MKSVFGYIRVSTQKQGQTGVSLQEQRAAIERYAERNGLAIVTWFEERETAAKRGRAVFGRMMKELTSGTAAGVVIHKIDRGARNLRDWADLGELIDGGVEVHFATESLDLHSRGGRLSADIQAVVAADYIRNLREETRKGVYGRLKQGLYPLPAPIGYLDRGRGRPKEPDPVAAPLVAQAFELYASGAWSLSALRLELARRGLRNGGGKPLSRNGLSILLNNPFYMGVIRVRTTGETFRGVHRPIVPPSLFNRVRAVLDGKTVKTSGRHGFLFRRLLRCGGCGYALTGEFQKGRVYYRCHAPDCRGACVREDAVEAGIRSLLARVQLTASERDELRALCEEIAGEGRDNAERWRQGEELRLAQLKARLDRLVDAYVDGMLEERLFTERKAGLLAEQVDIEHRLASLGGDSGPAAERLERFFELAASACSLYDSALTHEKRQLLDDLTSNRTVLGKNVDIALKSPFRELANRCKSSNGDPQRDGLRTLAGRLVGTVGTRLVLPERYMAAGL